MYLCCELKILFPIFVVLVSILLINLLIAMMVNTYDKTTELKWEWLRQVKLNLFNLICLLAII